MQKIQAKTRSVRELLSDTKYGIDYYQREYKWQKKQMEELVTDLTAAFLEEYLPTHERKDVAGYGHYFLGSTSLSASLRTKSRFVHLTTGTLQAGRPRPKSGASSSSTSLSMW